jgi:ankyrin repeat protein
MDSATLFAAIRAGDLATVERILAERPALAQASDDTGLSALTVAAYHGRWPIVERIQATGPDLDRFEAAIVGDVDRVRAQLDEAEREAEVERETAGRRRGRGTTTDDGASDLVSTVDERSPDGFSALHLAAFFGRPEVARLLLDRGADPNLWATGGLHVRPLHSAVAGGHEEVARLLVEAGADVGAAQDGGYTPLMGAAQNGSAGTVALLLERGADPKAYNQDILTAAELADRAGHPAVGATIRAAGG